MTGRDLYTSMSHINMKFIEEAESAPQKTRTPLRRTILVAAMLVLLLPLVGYAAVSAILNAGEPWISIPHISGTDIDPADIHVEIADITPGGLQYSCSIEGFVPEKQSITFCRFAPFTIERDTGSSWQLLSPLVEDSAWTAEPILTDGYYTNWIHWGAHYGYLEPGTYRLTVPLVEDHAPVRLEFEITQAMHTAALQKASALFMQDSWHVRGIWERETVEYWKSGDDYLQLSYKGETLVSGMLLLDGQKYRLVSNDLSSAVGWEPWPEMDINRLFPWETFCSTKLRLKTVPSKDGIVESWTLWSSGIDGSRFDEGVTILGTLEIVDTSAKEISQYIRNIAALP